jgi:hypothetical protein
VRANRTMAWALGGGAIVVLLSGGVAYLTTDVLDSSASGNLRGWSVRGGIAAFGFTFLLLGNLVFQLYKEMNRDKAEEYLKQIQELQSKLIRGAPQPEGFLVDIDEHHKLVFARPEKWVPKGGILYQYIEPKPVTETNVLPANFNVVFETTTDLEKYGVSSRALERKKELSPAALENLYKNVIEQLRAMIPHMVDGYALEGFAQEYLFVDGLKSVRYTHTYSANVTMALAPVEDASPASPTRVRITQVGIAIFQPRLAAMFVFTFSDDAEDFLTSSEDFNRIVSSIRFL